MWVITYEGCRQLQGATARKLQPPSAGRGQRYRSWGAPPHSLISRRSGVTAGELGLFSSVSEAKTFEGKGEVFGIIKSSLGVESTPWLIETNAHCFLSLTSSPSEKWDKTQSLEFGQALSSVHQSPISVLARVPTPLLWIHPPTQSPQPPKQSR